MAQNNLTNVRDTALFGGVYTQCIAPGVDLKTTSYEDNLGFYVCATSYGNLKVIPFGQETSITLTLDVSSTGFAHPLYLKKIVADAGNTANVLIMR